MKFETLNLKTEILETLHEMGFEEPTPIQQEAIPLALEGKDLIGQAQTGTGKTAAFGLPMLHKMTEDAKYIQGLVVAPTRELAIQVQEELYKLGKGQRARVYVVYGGTPIGKQIDRLQKMRPHIIVGTPGRLLDLINRHVLNLSQLHTLVLDEADEMLNMGFIEDIEAIIKATPKERQTLLFSATMPPAIKKLGSQFLQDPSHVKIKANHVTSDLIEQFFVKCRDDEKFDMLTRLIEVQNPKQAIVFCRTKKRVDEVGRGLSLRGFNAEMIHGDITQQKRTQVMKEFKKETLEILVATDVAARGLDISGITHVYNYDITQDPESYVHRVGRTGRAGADGVSITFVLANEMPYLRTIEALTQKKMQPLAPLTDKDAQRGQVIQLIDRVKDTIEHSNIDRYRNVAKQLMEHYEANDIISALMSEIIVDSTEVQVEISPQKPLPNANRGKRQNKQSGGRSGGHKRSNNRRGKHQSGGRRHKQSSGSKKGSAQNKSSDGKSSRNQSNFKIKKK